MVKTKYKMKSKKQRLSDLGIDVVEPKDAHHHPSVYHKVLPQHEFSMLIVAPKGSGKTNFLCNLLLKHYKGYFHKALICSPTVNNDEKWEVVQNTKHVLKKNTKLKRIVDGETGNKGKITRVVFHDDAELRKEAVEDDPFDGRIPKEDFFTDIAELPQRIAIQQNLIQELHDQHKLGKAAKFTADRMIVVLDDQAGMFKGGNTNNPMVNYVIRHRHVSSSVIIVTQAYKAIPKTIRTNCNALILFDIPNLSELKVIYEENPEGLNEDEWMRVYRHATQEPFSFMYINNKFDKGKRIYKNFTHLLQVGRASSPARPRAAGNGAKDGSVDGATETPVTVDADGGDDAKDGKRR